MNLQIFEYICNEFMNIRIYSYSNLLLIRIFEYIRIPIRIRILDIRQKIFEYSNIFEYSLRSDENIQ